jgi:isopenicillin-N epimerase
MKHLFLLDPSVTFLNFGSYGACPAPVFEEYIRWQRLLESEPVQYISVNGPAYMKESRDALGAYIGCDGDDLVYTPNPTFAENIVAKNVRLSPGDEILSTDLEYGAMDRTWNYYCGKADAKFVRQPIRFPLESKEDFMQQFWKGYSPKTKAIFISHITSATALILPVKEICAEAKRRGLITMVDGAHVPGHIPLDLREIEADYYTGACHKWMMTPKGSSFLYVKKEFQDALEPLIISWGYEADNPSKSRFLDYHQFNGTRDFSAYLCIPAAIRFMNDNDWPSVAARCRQLVSDWAPRFCEKLNTKPIAPITGEWLGQMFSIPIKTSDPEKLYNFLFDEHRIEIPVTRRGGEYFIRYSINGYNDAGDLEKLLKALENASAVKLLNPSY